MVKSLPGKNGGSIREGSEGGSYWGPGARGKTELFLDRTKMRWIKSTDQS